MGVVFKYKDSLEYAYAPGIADSGEDGDRGDKGLAGPCIYFVGYDLDNSYSISLALQKIQNNLVLSDEKTAALPGDRVYKNNDIIISVSGQCYRLVEDTGSEYGFNIEYTGQISKNDVNDPNPILKVLFIALDNNSTYFSKRYSNSQNACVPPTNYISQNFNSNAYKLDGVWLLPVVYTSETLDLDIKLYSSVYKEYTSNKLPNETEDSSRIKGTGFEKYLEFSEVKASILGGGASTVWFNPYYISNMALDKIETNNKIYYTGVSGTYNNTVHWLTYYQQGVSESKKKTPDSRYDVVFAENPEIPGTYVQVSVQNGVETYVKIPADSSYTGDSSYGIYYIDSGLPQIPVQTQQSLLSPSNNNTLIYGTGLSDTEMCAGTAEQWSSVRNVYDTIMKLSRKFSAEISYTKDGRLYSYTINNILIEKASDYPEIFAGDVLTTDSPYSIHPDKESLIV